MTKKSDSGAPDGAFPGWPVYGQDEIDAVAAVLSSGRVNYWTGDEGRKFEREFARYVGVDHGIATSNGSQALGLALRSLQLEPGAEVIVTPRSFVASAAEIVLAGLRPVFADIDTDSQNLTAATIGPAITANTGALVVVHLAGWPCDMDSIMNLAREAGISVIEDCAQAHGAEIRGRKAGSWGDLGAFSFCQDKIMSTGGEGGMITTSDPELWQRCWSMKDHGKQPVTQSNGGGSNLFRYLHESFGTNARMTEVQSAIGRIQLGKLDDWVRRRGINAARLNRRFAEVDGLRTAVPAGDARHAWYKYYCFVRPERFAYGWSRDRVLTELHGRGIPCGSGICPELYREKAFAQHPSRPPERLRNARLLGETALMFPVHPTMGDEDIDRIADEVTRIVDQAMR